MFGVEINGDARAYPLRILDWHEMLNDVVGGVPVTLAYCTLCGSGILYDARVPGREEPFVFGSSGFLYRSNKLMYDQATHSLVEPVHRPAGGRAADRLRHRARGAAGRDRELAGLARAPSRRPRCSRSRPASSATTRPASPMATTSRAPELMFPVLVPTGASRPRTTSSRCASAARDKAWPLAAFAGGAVINDRIGELAGGADRRCRDPDGARLSLRRPALRGGAETGTLRDGGDATWRIEESALVGPGGRAARAAARPRRLLVRLAGFIEGAPLAE